jgi:uroporphyrinogen-III synthase
LKIKKILVSQPKPQTEKSPYFDLAEKNNIQVDFRPFIEVEGIPSKDFRKYKVSILDHEAVIFSSRTAVDHFFRICKEMRVEVPDTMKYFCISEAIAFYLQKYIVYRKRKIFYGNSKINDLVDVLMKHKEDKFLVPLSENHQEEIPEFLTQIGIKHSLAFMYKTVSANLTELPEFNYDMLVFFSPLGVKSLLHNFPNFEQNGTKIASFGSSTANAVKDAGLRLDIAAPSPEAPSMTLAIELYIQKLGKEVKKK